MFRARGILRADDEGDSSKLIGLGRQYFTALDRASHPAVGILAKERLLLVQRMLEMLRTRVLDRRRHLGIASASLACGAVKGITKIGESILRLLEGNFCWRGGVDPSLELIGRVHDRFAWGGLRTPAIPGIRVPNNVPDGAPIFYFAEFAFLAIEAGVDTRKWRVLLPALVRMPALYIRTFELSGQDLPRPMEAFASPPFQENHEHQMKGYADELRVRFASMEIGALSAEFGEIARKAFSDT